MTYHTEKAIKLLRLAASWIEEIDSKRQMSGLPSVKDDDCIVSNPQGMHPTPLELAKEMEFVAMRIEHPSYVSIFEGAGGWNCAFFAWDVEMQNYDICQTGLNNTSLGSGTKEDAISEAKQWAESEGVEFRCK